MWRLPRTTRKAYFSDLGSWRILLSTIMVLQNCLGLCPWILNQLSFQLQPLSPLTAQKQKQDLSLPHKVKVTTRTIKRGSLCTTESKTAKKVASSLLWVPTLNSKNRRRDTHTQAGTHTRHKQVWQYPLSVWDVFCFKTVTKPQIILSSIYIPPLP